MDTSKIIRGIVNGRNYTVTSPIVKEDYGLVLQIEGVELPPTYQVDFSNSESNGTSVTMIGNADGVLIPHQFISTGKDVFAFLYHVGSDFGRTVYKFRIPNKVRPDRTNEEPTPEEQSVIDQAITALNNAVDACEDARDESATNVTHYPIITDGYWYVWDAENSEYVNTEVKAEGEDGVGISSIEKIATVDLVDTYTVTFTDGTTFDYTVTNGSNGTDGNGISSIAKTSTSGLVDTYTITYTDGTTTTYTVTNGADGDDYVLTSADKEDIARNYSVNTVTVSGTTPNITASANTRYICGEVATLDFTPSASGICDVVFTSGSTPTVVTLPNTVKFPDGAFTAEADTTYEINILDGIYGAVMAWT